MSDKIALEESVKKALETHLFELQHNAPASYRWTAITVAVISLGAITAIAYVPRNSAQITLALIISLDFVFLILTMGRTDPLKDPQVRKQALFLAWAFSILSTMVACLLVASLFFQWPLKLSAGDPSTATGVVENLRVVE